jgi:simple sugar transport system substrate-binding protein
MIAEADDLAERIASGAYHPFTGPILAQDGSVLVPEGEVASDEQLLGMSTYAEGVVGSIPG